ncbi:MAG: helix-turn-helix transcriptional regulator [Bacillota bacterium]
MSYVRGRKLHFAAKRLKNSNDKIAEIAYDYGFESHDVFGRAFKRTYGITPENYRRGWFLLPTFHAINLAQQQKGAIAMINTKLHTVIVTKPAMKLIGIDCRFEDGISSPDLWKQYFDEWQQTFGNIAQLIETKAGTPILSDSK